MRVMADSPHRIALALGANIGDRLAALRAAREGLARYMTLEALSNIYETPPAYVTDQPPFLNAALTGKTLLDPLALLLTIKEIERHIGRKPTFRNGPRVIDIDILFYDDLRMQTPELTIPHPAMAERFFVLRPLADVAGDWIHPVTRQTVNGMLSALPGSDGAQKISEAL